MLNNHKSTIAVIGSGFAGLSAAAVLASQNNDVTVFEKNAQFGGRARVFESNGFVFDMGPSWYWMPDVYEKFYNLFGNTTSDFYELKKLDPGFKVIFGKNDSFEIPANFEEVCELFESIEPGAADKLKLFINDAEYKYHVGMNGLVYKPSNSITEFINFKLMKDIFRLQVFSPFSKHVRKYFKDPRLISLIEFPVLFLGAMPKDTPALYSLMNFSGLKQGTFYPMGGFGKVIDAFKTIAEKAGVNFLPSQNIDHLEIQSGAITHVHSNTKCWNVDGVIGAADYHHIETKLLPKKNQSYSESYWDSRTFAPSSLIFYLGINKKIKNISHHNLFFDENFEQHAQEIYINKKWPTAPLFYVCCPSKTDPTVAPENSENIFILMPIATGLSDTEEIRNQYYKLIMDRLEKFAGENISDHVIFKKSYSVSNFINDYNAYKGNAYGLANTLFQTAFLKPKLKSKKVKNLFYAGQLTVPGPGVPPSIISGQVAANELLKTLNY